MTLQAAEPNVASAYNRPHNRPARVINFLVLAFCWLSALLAIGVLLAVFGYVLYRGVGALVSFSPFHFNWAFWGNPTPPDQPGGVLNGIQGTIVLILMSSAIGVPLGMLTGIYLAEYARAGIFSESIRLVVDVLAGVPSIVVGVLAYELVVVPMGNYSAYAGALALAFMMCPIVARTTEEMLKLVPKAYREASVGVGASQFQTLVRVVLPAARSGIITGVMLAVARVAGETAPLLFTALGSDLALANFTNHFPYIQFHAPISALDHAFPALTVQIFTYATSPYPEWIKRAWGGMLVLILIVLVLNMAVRYVSANKHRQKT